MKRISFAILVLTLSVPVDVRSEEPKSLAASGLWRLDWQDGRLGYLCVDEAHQPWRVIGDVDRLYDCWVEDSAFQERNGNRLRVMSEKTERHWREAGEYRVELSCVNRKFSSAQGEKPWSVATSVIKRAWKGDYQSRLDFVERGRSGSSTGSTGEVDLPEVALTGSHSMRRVSECPASMAAGRKCRIPTADSPASSEWPACDPELTGKTNP
jgi:hypothetical protein